MVFICPPKDQSERRMEVICKLKKIVDKLSEDEGKVPIQMNPPPNMCYPCCYPCCQPSQTPVMPQPQQPIKQESRCLPDMMVCYKVQKPKAESKKNVGEGKSRKSADVTQVKQSKSRELRGGVLYSGCDCEKRNGLQDDCQRSECRGSPACLTKPNPTCGPSQFSNAKHLAKKGRGAKRGNEWANENNNPSGEGRVESENNTTEYMCFPAMLDTSLCCC